MKFKYSAFTKNTPEMREWLEKLGYNVNYTSDDRYLRTFADRRAEIYHYTNWIYEDEQPINCVNNPSLFKAVTAIREDSGYMQWFVHDMGEWILCKHHSFIEHGYIYSYRVKNWHKATLEELEAKFKAETPQKR